VPVRVPNNFGTFRRSGNRVSATSVPALLKLSATTLIFWSLWFGVYDRLADVELLSILFQEDLGILKVLGVGVVVYSLGKRVCAEADYRSPPPPRPRRHSQAQELHTRRREARGESL